MEIMTPSAGRSKAEATMIAAIPSPLMAAHLPWIFPAVNKTHHGRRHISPQKPRPGDRPSRENPRARCGAQDDCQSVHGAASSRFFRSSRILSSCFTLALPFPPAAMYFSPAFTFSSMGKFVAYIVWRKSSV